MNPADLHRLRMQAFEAARLFGMIADGLQLESPGTDVAVTQLASLAERAAVLTVDGVYSLYGVSALRKLHDAGLVTPRELSHVE